MSMTLKVTLTPPSVAALHRAEPPSPEEKTRRRGKVGVNQKEGMQCLRGFHQFAAHVCVIYGAEGEGVGFVLVINGDYGPFTAMCHTSSGPHISHHAYKDGDDFNL